MEIPRWVGNVAIVLAGGLFVKLTIQPIVRPVLEVLGPPRTWLMLLLPAKLFIRIVGEERAIRLAIEERQRLEYLSKNPRG
jgi:hypothetical protein